MLPGETIGFDGVICEGDDLGDGKHDALQLKLEVCRSAAGYYLGYNCPYCGPYSRETGYFDTKKEAEEVLNDPIRMIYHRSLA